MRTFSHFICAVINFNLGSENISRWTFRTDLQKKAFFSQIFICWRTWEKNTQINQKWSSYVFPHDTPTMNSLKVKGDTGTVVYPVSKVIVALGCRAHPSDQVQRVRPRWQIVFSQLKSPLILAILWVYIKCDVTCGVVRCYLHNWVKGCVFKVGFFFFNFSFF